MFAWKDKVSALQIRYRLRSSSNVPETFDVFLGVAPKDIRGFFQKDRILRTLASVYGQVRSRVRSKNIFSNSVKTLGLKSSPLAEVGLMGGPIKTMVDKNVIAVGDAAELLMPSNGGASQNDDLRMFWQRLHRFQRTERRCSLQDE